MGAGKFLPRSVLLIWATLLIMGCPDRVGQPGPQNTGDQQNDSNTLEIRKEAPAPQPGYNPKKYVLPFNHGEP